MENSGASKHPVGVDVGHRLGPTSRDNLRLTMKKAKTQTSLETR